VTELLANSQNKTAAKPLSTYAEFHPATLLFPFALASFPSLRSSIGNPPMITALRI
jgi:hypothetical protein